MEKSKPVFQMSVALKEDYMVPLFQELSDTDQTEAVKMVNINYVRYLTCVFTQGCGNSNIFYSSRDK